MKVLKGGRKQAGERTGVSLHPDDAHDYTSTVMTVPAQDYKGQSDRWIFRVPASMTRQVDVLKNAQGLGFKTQTDVQRSAAYEGLKILNEMAKDPTLSNLQAITDAWVSSCRIEEEYINFANTIDHITGTVNKLMAMNAPEKGKELVRQIVLKVRSMDDPYWKKRYDEALKERFGYLLGETKK